MLIAIAINLFLTKNMESKGLLTKTNVFYNNLCLQPFNESNISVYSDTTPLQIIKKYREPSLSMGTVAGLFSPTEFNIEVKM